MTPLMYAALRRDLSCAQQLLSLGADLDILSHDGFVAYTYAFRSEHIDVALALREYMTLFFMVIVKSEAKRYHRVMEILGLVSRSAVHLTDVGRASLCFMASLAGLTDVVAKLLPTVKMDELDSFCMLVMAVEMDNDDLVNLLLAAGAEVSLGKEKKSTALHYAASNNDFTLILRLLDLGCGTDVRDAKGATPAYWAARAGNDEALHLLLEFDANVNVKDDLNVLPIHYAARYGYAAVVSELIEAGSLVEAIMVSWRTVLHEAAKSGMLMVVDILLNKGVFLNARCLEGWTPLHIAAYAGHGEVALRLIAAGADINATCDMGFTPLYIAAG